MDLLTKVSIRGYRSAVRPIQQKRKLIVRTAVSAENEIRGLISLDRIIKLVVVAVHAPAVGYVERIPKPVKESAGVAFDVFI